MTQSSTQPLKWAVLYSPTLDGEFVKVADEYADSREDVERAIRHDYSREETPLGFYKLRPEFGGHEFLLHKHEHDPEFWDED